MSDLLPAVLLNALKQYSFDASPLWRMADGKDHVKIEVTFRKATNQRFDKKGGGWSRKLEAAYTPCWQVASPAHSSPTTDDYYASSPTDALYGEGDATTTITDSTRHYKIYHHTLPHAEDNHHRAITNHHSTTNTASYSRQSAEEEDADAVTNSASQQSQRSALPATPASTFHIHCMRSTTSRESSTSR